MYSDKLCKLEDMYSVCEVIEQRNYCGTQLGLTKALHCCTRRFRAFSDAADDTLHNTTSFSEQNVIKMQSVMKIHLYDLIIAQRVAVNYRPACSWSFYCHPDLR